MKAVRVISDRMLEIIVPKAQAKAVGEICRCNPKRPCGPGGLRDMLCCDRPGQTPNYVCYCGC